LIILLSRFVNIFVCTYLANISRTESRLDFKKQFFLWFAGVRGAMALALAIKSKFDFPGTGPIFLVLTLIIISFTIIYSTLFVDITLKRCEIISVRDVDCCSDKNDQRQNCFSNLKRKIEEWNQRFLMPCTTKEPNNSNNQSDISHIDQQMGLFELNQKNSEKIKIHNDIEKDKADKLVIAKDGHQ